MTICNAYLLKGWLIAEHAPAEIMEAVGSVIESLSAASPKVEVVGHAPIEIPSALVEDHQPQEPAAQQTDMTPGDDPPAKPTKRKHNWSPEARAAQAERMRTRNAARLISKKQPKSDKGNTATRGRSWGFSGGQPEPVTLQGETTTFTDEHGHKVTKLPPGYARGAEPDRRVRPKRGHGF